MKNNIACAECPWTGTEDQIYTERGLEQCPRCGALIDRNHKMVTLDEMFTNLVHGIKNAPRVFLDSFKDLD